MRDQPAHRHSLFRSEAISKRLVLLCVAAMLLALGVSFFLPPSGSSETLAPNQLKVSQFQVSLRGTILSDAPFRRALHQVLTEWLGSGNGKKADGRDLHRLLSQAHDLAYGHLRPLRLTPPRDPAAVAIAQDASVYERLAIYLKADPASPGHSGYADPWGAWYQMEVTRAGFAPEGLSLHVWSQLIPRTRGGHSPDSGIWIQKDAK